ncbi:MAG: pseudaminic acid cytidylyltransferase [Bacteroidetes bacterium]|nr:pseudaminic acid cytidylyltransferase [Bacteroidota bacterium]MBS1633511.1 pseudaminic acid cytidylyltransferase [Bacteroidota bacterium]
MKKSVAIITARGGSKRIPRKNIKSFSGKPIICYSIEAAKASGIFDTIMVSTDDNEIAEVARQAGAEIPFLRSAATSNDFATTAEVLIEVLNQFKEAGEEFQYGCCIYPTAPFVTSEKLIRAFDLLLKNKADSVIPVTRFSFPIWRSFKMDEGKLAYNWPENALRRSQDLPASFHDCGQFYFFDTEKFLASKSLVTTATYAIEVPESEVQDIDNEDDWKIAEIKYSFLQNK